MLMRILLALIYMNNNYGKARQIDRQMRTLRYLAGGSRRSASARTARDQLTQKYSDED